MIMTLNTISDSYMLKNITGIFIVALTIFAVTFMLKSKKTPKIIEGANNTAMKIVTAPLSPKKQDIIIKGSGNVDARWQTTLSSEVTGTITDISDKLLVGASFSKGEMLLKIDQTTYEADLNRQQANLAAAEERLIDEQIRAKRAQRDWSSLNSGKQASDYTLRKPQLNSAKKNHQAALADVKAAQTLLEKTIITAPYDGYVVNRYVDMGEVVQIGTQLADVFSSNQLELTLPLKHQQVEMILASQSASFLLFDTNNPETTWQAQLSRVDQLIDKNSRWRNIFLNIDTQSNHDKKLPITGAFLQAQITLDLDKEFLIIDEKSLSMQGDIWSVDDNQLLQKTTPKTAFSNAGNVYLYPEPDTNYPIDLVIFPSSSLLEGVEVIQQNLVNEVAYE